MMHINSSVHLLFYGWSDKDVLTGVRQAELLFFYVANNEV